MEPLSARELLRMHLQQPEYLHVLLNPLPVYGLFIGLVAMGLALLLRHRRAELVALSLVFLSTLSAWPVAAFGDKGYDRVLTLADEDGQAWLAAHAKRAEQLVPLFLAVAALSAAAAFIPFRWPAWRKPLWYATLAGALVALACGGWLGYSGGKIRHKEFRYTPPPRADSPGAAAPPRISLPAVTGSGTYPFCLCCALPLSRIPTT